MFVQQILMNPALWAEKEIGFMVKTVLTIENIMNNESPACQVA